MSIRPILRWAGSKRKLLPYLLASAPISYKRYIEPFLGSGCFFLALQPARALLGDFNVDLMAMYSVLRRCPGALALRVHSMPNTMKYYYQLRSQDQSELRSIDRAARFIYLNRFCFNGVYRENRAGKFNVPRGSHTGKLPSIDEFRECAKAFRRAVLCSGDFEKCLKNVRKGDFVYLDPPYATSRRQNDGEYGYDCFTEKDIPRLVTALKVGHDRGASILLSYSSMPLLRKELPDWNFREIKIRRNIAGFSHQRLDVTEVLVSNYAVPDGIPVRN